MEQELNTTASACEDKLETCYQAAEEAMKELRSVTVEKKEDHLTFFVVRYRGQKGKPSEAQIKYLVSLAQCDSKSQVRKMNKWAISHIIDFCQKHEGCSVRVVLD